MRMATRHCAYVTVSRGVVVFELSELVDCVVVVAYVRRRAIIYKRLISPHEYVHNVDAFF